MQINPFRIPTATEAEAIEAMVEREKWEHACRALGATEEQVRAFDRSAHEYAMTTIWPNHEVVAAARAAALRRLAHGEPMPTDAEQLHQSDRLRALAALLA